jgi:hypothetical protein
MTRAETISLALDAGFNPMTSEEMDMFEAFSKLVAAKEREIWERRVARLQSLMDLREQQPNKPCCIAEREACAEICKKHADVYAMLEQNPTTKAAWAACIDNLDAIRARGKHD